jgi:hypothetical protein
MEKWGGRNIIKRALRQKAFAKLWEIRGDALKVQCILIYGWVNLHLSSSVNDQTVHVRLSKIRRKLSLFRSSVCEFVSMSRIRLLSKPCSIVGGRTIFSQFCRQNGSCRGGRIWQNCSGVSTNILCGYDAIQRHEGFYVPGTTIRVLTNNQDF